MEISKLLGEILTINMLLWGEKDVISWEIRMIMDNAFCKAEI